jgi:hypothetical protein
VARPLSSRRVFVAAYLLLGVAAGSAIGTAIVLAQRPAPPPPPRWSSWKPGTSSLRNQALEIANHVGQTYRLASGDQLANVRVTSPAGDKKLRAIGIPTKAKPQTLADFRLYDNSKTVYYLLCGAGSNCKIDEGTASRARGTVLRREALELALYTLEYAHSADNVVVFFPPGPGQKKVTSSLFFQRGGLESSLSHPLRRTLPQVQPPLPGRIGKGEQKTVDELTSSLLYKYVGVVTARGYGNLVVLEPA